MPRNRSHTVSVLAAGALVAVALIAPTSSDAAPTDATARAVGRNVSVSISKSHVITMPKVLRPGVHRITIHSKKDAELQIVWKRRGYTDKELARDANAAMSQGKLAALKRFEKNTIFISGVVTTPGKAGTLVTSLARGKYIAVDITAPKTTTRKMTHFTVSGKRLTGKVLKVPTIKAVHEVDFAAKPASISRHGMLGFANKSTDNHFIEVTKLQHGKSIGDLTAWMNATKHGQDAGAPPVDEAHSIESGIVSPGHRMSFAYHLPAGNYVVICWWPDAEMGGMPHAFMGMYRAITVK